MACSVKNVNMIDAIAFNNQKWVYNEELERYQKISLSWNQGKFIRLGQKIGRNDKCHCGVAWNTKNVVEKNAENCYYPEQELVIQGT